MGKWSSITRYPDIRLSGYTPYAPRPPGVTARWLPPPPATAVLRNPQARRQLLTSRPNALPLTHESRVRPRAEPRHEGTRS